MQLSQLEFGTLLSYAPRGDSPEILHSKDVMVALKRDGFVGEPPILMSEWVARTIQRGRTALPFASFFQPNTILVPTPKSSLMQPNTLWVPERIATALVKRAREDRSTVLPFLPRMPRCLASLFDLKT